MIRSRKAAIIASLLGALLVAGAPTMAMGGEDGADRERVTVQSADASSTASDDVSAQKAKDDEKHKADEKKKAEKKDDGNKAEERKAAEKKEAERKAAEKKAAEKKTDNESRQAAEKKKDADKRDGGKKDGDKKDWDKKDGDKRDSDRKRHDNNGKHENKGKKDERADGKRHKTDGKHGKDGKRDVDDKDEWRRKDHKDRHNKHWDHSRDRDRRHRYGWDTHRRYYRYGYYGPGWYDQCGYYGSRYNGYGDDYYYNGPDACRYEYGGYRSSMLVEMSWDQVIPRSEIQDVYGVANLEIDVPAGVLCYRLAYDGIDRAIGAQIHPGRIGEVGPSIVLFHVGQNGDDGCVSADPAILSEIQNDPRGYYLEVNDADYGQVMRGQLDAPDYRGRY